MACYAFTKLLCPLVKYTLAWARLASPGLPDDGIVAVAGKENAKKASLKVREDLIKAGLVEHSAWVPIKWLGFKLDLQQGQISVPQEKINSLKDQLSKAVGGRI